VHIQVTDYGRSFSAEKLARSSVKDEEKPFHGFAAELPAWLLVGGNFRQVQSATETSSYREGRWIAMQRDVDVCVKRDPAIACVTGGIVRRSEQDPDGKTRYGARKFVIQSQFGESLLVREGRFSPRYGLMIADHTSSIKRGLGFGLNDERDQLEFTYTTETYEVAVGYEFGRTIKLNIADRDITTKTSGMTATAMMPIKNTHRVGTSYRSQKEEDRTIQTVGLFGAQGFTELTYLLLEVDQQDVLLESAPEGVSKRTDALVSYAKLGHEVTAGVVGYVSHQKENKGTGSSKIKREQIGLGLQWFPRPHFEVEGFYGKIFTDSSYSFTNLAYLVLHYYL